MLIAFGTRPEAIKLAPVIQELRSRNTFEIRLCSTGQHKQMLNQVCELFSLAPELEFNLMDSVAGLHELSAQILLKTADAIDSWKPDVLMVHGDTTTCLAAGLAGFYSGVPIAHVEAGLRTGSLTAPFPEEGNRAMVARITRWHFAPTEAARKNLLAEKVSDAHIFVTGNTVIDALLHLRHRTDQLADSALPASLEGRLTGENTLLVTGHRRENFGRPLEQICSALARIADLHPKLDIVYPVHLNPNVREVVNDRLQNIRNIHLTPPLDYVNFIALLSRCDLVLTDSGGIQEEAPAFGKPVLVMRETTERPEAIDAGTARLVGTDPERICREVHTLLADPTEYASMARAENPFGDGRAAKRIADTLEAQLCQSKTSRLEYA